MWLLILNIKVNKFFFEFIISGSVRPRQLIQPTGHFHYDQSILMALHHYSGEIVLQGASIAAVGTRLRSSDTCQVLIGSKAYPDIMSPILI